MKINLLNLVYFSPTKTTEKIINAIAKGIAIENKNTINLTKKDGSSQFIAEDSQFNIIGVPVYSGRVPVIAKERLKKIKANNSLALIIVVYGNRDYEDALLELQDITENLGFKSIAAGAFIGEHSFSDDNTPIATGRPNEKDLQKAVQFGQQIKGWLDSLDVETINSRLNIPGNIPYREIKQQSPSSPETNMLKCTLCSTCENICPVGAIKIQESIITKKEECIWCCACIKNCPENARYINNEHLMNIKKWLFENFSEPKKPELFILPK